ncbi:killer cell lectin-like receptor subfamily B member 1B allele A isoform X8 [Xiphias gladius]|uniref:killer cell lectin-like receptor subfamily B member 1B allele A isoform X8 n=1 Tax=Xiphias gladius TaxID=8245 RepID=UPI001A99409D|nr:killer cell lectin-like receptor subfamily B member 1B allele A isoform X8 [Xiphias gladius]
MNRKTQRGTSTFKSPNASLSAEKLEEDNYVNTAVCAVDKMPATADKNCPSFTRSIPTIAVSWVIMLAILALCIYFTSVISENITKLMAENQILTTQTMQLETQRNHLTEQLRNMQTNLNVVNVTRAQWSINAYCPKQPTGRKCEPCQDGWLLSQSSCYRIYDPEPKDQKTWEEAQQNCIGKNSDLAVVLNEEEKRFISDNSWGTTGYWIGLRVEGGRWKWLDGRNLTKSSWIQRPPEKDHCAISVKDRGWESVSCSVKHRWICKKAALSV